MRIVSYTADEREAPASALAVAFIHLGQDGWLPVAFRAPTEDEARARAKSHWDAETAKASKKADNRAAMSERRRKQPEPQPEPVIEEAF
jgi:hypothetical protein